jgi:ABC-2 type transport system permease protein
MFSLLRIELIKLTSYNAFRVLLILHLVLFSLVIITTSQLDITVPGFSTDYLYQFPNVWEFFPWVASWFNILLAILVIVITANEYSFRTFRQHVIDGLSRFQLLAGKGMVIIMLALYATLMVLLLSLIFGFVFTRNYGEITFTAKSYTLLVYFLQAVAYMVFGFFIAVLFRSTGLAITLFLLYRIIIEPVFRLFFPKAARMYFPIKAISGLTPTPEFVSITRGNVQINGNEADPLSLREAGILPEELPLLTNVLLTAGYTVLFIWLAYILLKKRNL